MTKILNSYNLSNLNFQLVSKSSSLIKFWKEVWLSLALSQLLIRRKIKKAIWKLTWTRSLPMKKVLTSKVQFSTPWRRDLCNTNQSGWSQTRWFWIKVIWNWKIPCFQISMKTLCKLMMTLISLYSYFLLIGMISLLWGSILLRRLKILRQNSLIICRCRRNKNLKVILI